MDLEDAVKTTEKTVARAHVRDWLAHTAQTQNLPPTVVRVNARQTPEFDADMHALAGCARAVLLAKVAAPVRLAFGNVDFAASIGVDAQDERALLFARQILARSVCASPCP